MVSITLAWFYPHHVWAGNTADPTSDLGNRYSELFADSEDVARRVALNRSLYLQRALDYHALFLDSDLPEWLQDALINS